ncbi:MAG TPA: T9SS type A sorting domain-containing protein, partial [Saprospiraceae bacterium]|nr:T9SS type A sorting domain-containing protein [Saprospiraceae bacterium]
NYPHEFSLIRQDNQESIPFTTSCFENKVIFNTVPPLIEQPDLDGVLLTARVALLQDGNGNVQEYPTQWSFLVNVSPVFWDPEDLYDSGTEGQAHIVHAKLKNTSLLSKAFSLDMADSPLISYPDWLTPIQKHGTILSNNEYSVDFNIAGDLPPGVYTGTVTAMVDELPVTMNVTFEQLAHPVNWNFDPSAYQYSMTLVAQFSLDGGNTNLSTDTRDVIGAFVNGEIRGITTIQYVPGPDVYRAFLTIYSNDQGGSNGEKIKFKFWRALTGVEYGAIESVTFTLDNTIGSVSNPTILHPEGFFQIIPLKKGWNWISLNLATTDMTREHIFENLLNSPTNNSITIKSKTSTAQYSPASNWNGNLSTLNLGSGYLVNLSNAPDTLRVVGLPSSQPLSVNVGTGWNWIGFPRLNEEPVNTVLADLTKVQGDLLKSQDRFSAWDVPTQSWLGNLDQFTPGKGYKLKLANAGTIYYEASRGDSYDFNPYAYEYNLNVTGYADLDMIGERHEDDFIIGAFIEGECRGTGVLEYITSIGAYRTLMLVHGNTTDFGKPIEFRFFNDRTGAEYIANGDQLNFVADGLVGSVVAPYLFFLNPTTGTSTVIEDGYQMEQSRPNPTSGRTSFGFTLPNPDHVVLRLFNLRGEMIKEIANSTFDAGHHTVDADLSYLPEGVYYYELLSGNFAGVKKLVRQ